MNTKLPGFVYGVDASSMFAQAMSLLQKGLIAVGAFSCRDGDYQPFH